MNAKERYNQKMISLFILLAFILVAPLVALQAWSSRVVKQKQDLFMHLNNLAILPSHIKYSVALSIESLYRLTSLPLLPENPAEKGHEYYNELSYEIFSGTSDFVETSLPGVFSDYVDKYKTVIFKNPCSTVPGLNTDQCTLNTFITTGVYTSSTQILTRASDAFKQQVRITAAGSSRADMKIQMQGIFGNDAVEILMLMNGKATDYLIQMFYDKLNSYIKQVFVVELLIVILGIVVLLLVCLFIWRPYVANLNSNIWRTKGMLSMIPMEVILANDSLRTAMLSGDLMKAVK